MMKMNECYPNRYQTGNAVDGAASLARVDAVASPALHVLSRRARRPGDAFTIGLVNNMADAARDATERQFRDLLEQSAGPVAFRLHQFSPSLDASARDDPNCRHFEFSDLWDSRLDALIVTGMEPQAVDLRDEPRWSLLRELFDWAERNEVPTALSCLAAHAAVLHRDGVVRRRLPDKRFGVFRHAVLAEHPLTRGLSRSLCVPHSRWNELDANELADCGYQILTASPEAGVDLFVKQRRCLFLHFQGHPEYGLETLLAEYRRDVRRFLCGARDIYPALPVGYFSMQAEQRLTAFRDRALRERKQKPWEKLWLQFPDRIAPAARAAPWRGAATTIYNNFLTYARSWNA